MPTGWIWGRRGGWRIKAGVALFFFGSLACLYGLLALFSIGNSSQITTFILIPNVTCQPHLRTRNTAIRCQHRYRF